LILHNNLSENKDHEGLAAMANMGCIEVRAKTYVKGTRYVASVMEVKN